MRRLIFLIACVGTLMHARSPYDSLSSIESYLAHMPEFVSPEGGDWQHPYYLGFFDRYRENWTYKLKRAVGMRPHLWDATEFRSLLERVIEKVSRRAERLQDVKERESGMQGVSSAHLINDFDTIHATSYTHLIVFGDTQGSIHSVARCLRECVKRGYLTEDLRVGQDGVAFIFLGNVVSRSPYTLETLSLILHLIDKNPDAVFLVQGDLESGQNWINYSMRQALQVRIMGRVDIEDIPFQDDIDKLFSLLPEMVKVVSDDAAIPSALYCVNDVYILSQDELIQAHACIAAEQLSLFSKPRLGVEFFGWYQGVPLWSIFSAPNLLHRENYNFFYDAFAHVYFDPTSADWCIERTIQNAVSPAGFETTCFNISWGFLQQDHPQPVTNPVLKTAIVRGMSTAEMLSPEDVGLFMSKQIERYNVQAVSSPAQPLHIPAYLTTFNWNVIDPTLRSQAINIFDRQYIDRMMGQDKTHVSLMPDARVAEMLAQNGNQYYFFFSDDMYADAKKFTHFITYRLPFSFELAALAKECIERFPGARVACVCEGSLPDEALTAFPELLAERGGCNVKRIIYFEGQYNLTGVYQQIRAHKPEVVIMLTSDPVARAIARGVGADVAVGILFMGTSTCAHYNFRSTMKSLGLRYVCSSVTLNPETNTSQIAQEYRSLFSSELVPFDTFSFERYLAIDLLHNLMLRTGSIDPAVLYKACTDWNAYAYKGITLTYDPVYRSLATDIWLFEDERAQQLSKTDLLVWLPAKKTISQPAPAQITV